MIMVTVVSVTVVKVPVAMAINGLFSALTTSVSPTGMPMSDSGITVLMTSSMQS